MLFLSALSSLFLNQRCRWVDGHDLTLPNVAQNLAAARFPPRGIRALRLEPPVGQIFERAIPLFLKIKPTPTLFDFQRIKKGEVAT